MALDRNRPRKHYYVPRFILEHFTDRNGQLHIFDKRRHTKEVFVSNPIDAFTQRDLNTYETPAGQSIWKLETAYAELEDQAALIVTKCLDNARERRTPNLDADELNLWFNFVYHQQKRAPDAFDRIGVTANLLSDIRNLVADYEGEHGQLPVSEKSKLEAPETIKRIRQSAIVSARTGGSIEIVKALAERGLAIAVAPPKKSFIIGDYPVVRMGSPDNQHLSAPTLEVWFPVSSDVAISPWGPPGTEQLIWLESFQVRRLNKAIFNQSNLCAARSEKLISSLAGVK
jgi:Protein of unknown function (DUF4238)